MMKLNEQEMEQAQALEIGEQININHEDCDAGEDRKKRLYIKRVENGNIIYYCHHCSESGVVHNSVPKNRKAPPRKSGAYEKRPSNGSSSVCYLPSDAEGDVSQWPAQARVWLRSYGITDGEIAARGIMYSDRRERVILPCWKEGKLVSWQSRRIFPHDKKPKYLSYGEKESVYYVPGAAPAATTTLIKRLCIVEDVLSAIKCGRFIDTIALRKATLSDKELLWIVRAGYKDFIIFLDDDNAQVKKSQIVLKNRLENLGTVRIVHSSGRDPKEHSDKELEELLCQS
jgi:hypothetical protein